MKKNMSKRKALVVELGSFILAAIIIVLMTAIMITATFFLSEEDPSITIHPAKFARNENDFAEGKYIGDRSSKIGVVLQALLNTKKEFKQKDGTTKMLTIKEALLEWSDEENTNPENYMSKEYPNIPQETLEYQIVKSFDEFIEKNIRKEYNVGNPFLTGSIGHGCYYLNITFREKSEEKNKILFETDPWRGNPGLEPGYLGKMEEIAYPKAAFYQIRAPQGIIQAYFYYQMEECVT